MPRPQIPDTTLGTQFAAARRRKDPVRDGHFATVCKYFHRRPVDEHAHPNRPGRIYRSFLDARKLRTERDVSGPGSVKGEEPVRDGKYGRLFSFARFSDLDRRAYRHLGLEFIRI